MACRHVGLAVQFLLMFSCLSQIAAGATLCVNKKPSAGCFTTSSAAVASAPAGDVIQVSPGTYHEDVVIGKAVSLIGASQSHTIIDASGLANRIYVDGLDNPGLSNVFVSGFQVQKANFEGILLTNAWL